MASLASPSLSHPTSPRPPLPSLPFSPRPPTSFFAAFDDSSLRPSPRPSSLPSSRSFNGFDSPLRFSFDQSLHLAPSSTPLKSHSTPKHPAFGVNASAYAGCTTDQKESVKDKIDLAKPRGNTWYSILNVPQSASPQEIRMAYRKLALQYHPDVAPLHQLDSATNLFSQINEAYAILSDPQKRKCYDLELSLKTPINGAVGYGNTRRYTNVANGQVYPSMNSFYREWKGTRNWETDQCWC